MKIYCCELALSSELQILKFHVIVWQTTSKHCNKERAAPAARLFFFIQPIKSFIGSEEYQKDYVDGKVTEWVGEIVKLAEIATTEPQACYSAYIFGLKHKWTYFLRTIPDTQDLLEPLERAVSQILIPTITGHKINQLERDVLSLPVRCGGLGFGNPQAEAARELNSSVETTAPLVDQIMSQQHQLPDDSVVNLAKQTSRHKREEDVKEKVRSIYERVPDNL